MKINIILFLLLQFFVGCFSDFVLNILSRHFQTFSSLEGYFKHYKAIRAMIYAGLTVLISAIFVLFTFTLFSNQFGELNIDVNIFYILLLSFIFGVLIDFLINKLKIFGKWLDKYYKKVTTIGSAILGGSAILFSSLITLGIISIINRLTN